MKFKTNHPGRSAVRPALGALSLAAVLVLATACGSGQNGEPDEGEPEFGSLEELIEAAQAEGTFTLYTGTNADHSQALLDAFYEEYGIGGAFFRAASGPLIQRFSAEREAGGSRADVYISSPPTFFVDNPDWFIPIDAETIPSVADYPAEWVEDNYIVISGTPVVAVYNTDEVAEADAPQTWQDLLDERYSGQILLTDPRQSDQYLSVFRYLMEEHGVEYLEALGDQDLRLVGGAVAGVQEVSAGAYLLNTPGFPGTALPTMQQGAPVQYVVLQEPSLTGELDLAIPAGAPNPATARLFAHWLLTENALPTLCQFGTYAVLTDPTGAQGCIPISDSVQRLDFTTSDEDRARILSALRIE